MRFDVRAEGAERLEARLMRLVTANEIDAALRAASEAIRSEAAVRLPDNADVGVTHEQNADSVRFRIGSVSRDAVNREDGTRNMAAQPWLTPAFAAIAPRLKQMLARAVNITRA